MTDKKNDTGYFYVSQCVLVVLSAFFTAYFVALACSEPFQFGFLFVWLFLGISCAVAALTRNFLCKAAVAAHTYTPVYRLYPRLFKAGIVAVCGCVVAVAGILCFIMSPRTRLLPAEVPYVISLGGGLHPDGSVSKSLAVRLDTAVSVLNTYPDAMCIVTGGLGKKMPWPESVGMDAYLQNNGISAQRIIQENRSRDTIENLAFTAQILLQKDTSSDTLPPVVIISSAYHLARAAIIAKKTGFTEVYLIGAPTPRIQKLNAYTREVLSVVKLGISILSGRIVPAVSGTNND